MYILLRVRIAPPKDRPIVDLSASEYENLLVNALNRGHYKVVRNEIAAGEIGRIESSIRLGARDAKEPQVIAEYRELERGKLAINSLSAYGMIDAHYELEEPLIITPAIQALYDGGKNLQSQLSKQLSNVQLLGAQTALSKDRSEIYQDLLKVLNGCQAFLRNQIDAEALNEIVKNSPRYVEASNLPNENKRSWSSLTFMKAPTVEELAINTLQFIHKVLNLNKEVEQKIEKQEKDAPERSFLPAAIAPPGKRIQ